MLICLDSSLISGYLSNEVPGLVTGVLNLAGCANPLRVELTGNFLRDIAGCRIEMLNPVPDANAKHVQSLGMQQDGYVGQMTASYRVQQVPRARKSNTGVFTPPKGLKNLLFLEWFNREKQRILIQSWHLHLTVSAPRWQQSRQAELAQIRQNRERRKQFLLGGDSGPHLGEGAADAFDDLRQGSGPSDTPPALAGLMEDDPMLPELEPSGEGLAAPALINQVSAELALELRRFEMLLASPGQVQSRPAVLRLLSTAGDLAAHLSHVLKNFSSLKSSQWQFLLTDLEQSLPLFHAALTAFDKLVETAAPGSDLRWLMNVQQTLCSVTGSVEQLMKWLRGH
jgi:hypothetical protein